MIDNKFELHDRVRIKELDWKGRILSIWLTERGIQYQVRFFANSKAELEYFYEEELEKI